MLPGMPKFPGEDFINSFYPILIALVLGLILGFRFVLITEVSHFRGSSRLATGHFGPNTVRTHDTSALGRWVRTVETFRQECHDAGSQWNVGNIERFILLVTVSLKHDGPANTDGTAIIGADRTRMCCIYWLSHHVLDRLAWGRVTSYLLMPGTLTLNLP